MPEAFRVNTPSEEIRLSRNRSIKQLHFKKHIPEARTTTAQSMIKGCRTGLGQHHRLLDTIRAVSLTTVRTVLEHWANIVIASWHIA